MNMLAVAKARFGRRTLRSGRTVSELEPVCGKPRAMTGFFAHLSEDQKRASLAYRGDENHGDENFPKA